MTAHAITNVDRGCGRRVAGGAYLEVGVGPGGLPIEAFLIDPVIGVGVDIQRAIGIAGPRGTMSLGVHLVPRDGMPGVFDVWDVVGEGYYPNVADFLEESRKYGVSRRITRTLDFSKISPYSRLVILHAKAAVINWSEVYAPDWKRPCPMIAAVQAGAPRAEVPETHERPATERDSLCAGIWWEDVTGDVPDNTYINVTGDARATIRQMPPGKAQWAYRARQRPDSGIPVYTLGLVAAFPLSRIAVVTDPIGDKHTAALTAANRALGVVVEESRD